MLRALATPLQLAVPDIGDHPADPVSVMLVGAWWGAPSGARRRLHAASSRTGSAVRVEDLVSAHGRELGAVDQRPITS